MCLICQQKELWICGIGKGVGVELQAGLGVGSFSFLKWSALLTLFNIVEEVWWQIRSCRYLHCLYVLWGVTFPMKGRGIFYVLPFHCYPIIWLVRTNKATFVLQWHPLLFNGALYMKFNSALVISMAPFVCVWRIPMCEKGTKWGWVYLLVITKSHSMKW